LSSSNIFFADFGQIHGIDWKYFTSNVLIAFCKSDLGNLTIWKAVLGQIQDILIVSSNISFC
jgi:hypothetical protein